MVPADKEETRNETGVKEGLEEFPLNYLGNKSSMSFDFDLLNADGSLLLPRGKAVTLELVGQLKTEGRKAYQRVSVLPDIISPRAIKDQAKETRGVFNEIRNSKLLKDDHVKHTRHMYEQVLNGLDEDLLKKGQLPLQAEVEGLDQFGYLHAVNAGCLAMIWGMKLHMPTEKLLSFAQAAYYLDVGKNRVPLAILQKSSRLTDQELAILQSHTQLGYLIINDYTSRNSDDESVNLAKMAALLHHMKRNGKGYPAIQRLPMFQSFKYENLSEEIRFLSIIDYYTALVEERPYRVAFSPEHALQILVNEGYRSFHMADINSFVNHLALALNRGALFYKPGDHVVLRNEILAKHGLQVRHEIALVEEINPAHAMRPMVSLIFDIDYKKKLKNNRIDLNKDFSRKIVRVLKSYDSEKKLAELGLS